MLNIQKYKFKTSFECRCVYISDIHERKIKKEGEILNKIRDLKPDIIFFGGDMVSRTTQDFTSFETICRECSNICDVYGAIGNHEQSLDQKKYDKYMMICHDNNINILDNDMINYEKKFYIAGYTPTYDVYRNENGGFSNLKKIDENDIKKAIGKKPNGFTILLCHTPHFAPAYANWGADITLSGHDHGGIVRLPKIGGLLSPERKFFPKYSLGNYSFGNKHTIVSSGIGKFRLFNPSDIIFIEFIK